MAGENAVLQVVPGDAGGRIIAERLQTFLNRLTQSWIALRIKQGIQTKLLGELELIFEAQGMKGGMLLDNHGENKGSSGPLNDDNGDCE